MNDFVLVEPVSTTAWPGRLPARNWSRACEPSFAGGLDSGVPTGRRVALRDQVVYTTWRTVSRGGARLALGALELNLLAALMRSPWRVLSRADIVEAVWGDADDVDPGAVEAAIGLLKAKDDGPVSGRLVRKLRGAEYLLDSTH